LKAVITVLLLVSACLAQSSSDGFFVVRRATKHASSLTPAEMREAEKLYRYTCAAVHDDFHNGTELHPRFTVILGARRNEVHGEKEIWLTKWNPAMFAEGVVVVAFHDVLSADVIRRLARRALQYSDTMVDVVELKQNR